MITRALLTLLLTRTDYPISWVSLKTGTCEWTNAVATQSIWVTVMSPILTFVNIWEYTMIYRGKLYEHNMKCIQKLGKHSSGLFAGAALHDRLDISLQKGKMVCCRVERFKTESINFIQKLKTYRRNLLHPLCILGYNCKWTNHQYCYRLLLRDSHEHWLCIH